MSTLYVKIDSPQSFFRHCSKKKVWEVRRRVGGVAESAPRIRKRSRGRACPAALRGTSQNRSLYPSKRKCFAKRVRAAYKILPAKYAKNAKAGLTTIRRRRELKYRFPFSEFSVPSVATSENISKSGVFALYSVSIQCRANSCQIRLRIRSRCCSTVGITVTNLRSNS